MSLRAVTADDLPELFRWQCDAESVAMAAVKSRDWDAFQLHWEKLLADNSVYKRIVEVDGIPVGHVGIFDRDGRREIGYWIAREHWGRGIATVAVAAAVAEVEDRPLHAWVASHNAASARVLEKCGFRRVGIEAGTRGDDPLSGIIFQL